MKFGKHMQQNMPPDWRFNFLDYNGLKHYVKDNSTAWNETLEDKFVGMLEEELKKVSDFGYVKFNELQRHVKFLETEFAKIEDPSTADNKDDLKEELDLVTSDITKLAKFNSLNYTGFLKLLKKHDKLTNIRLKNTFLARLTKQPFYKETFDALIVRLSTLYEKLKPKDRPELAGKVNLTSFVRKTTKYWVHADNITDVKCIILQNLPVLVFKQDKKFDRGYDAAITSIYFDNEQMDLYHERIEKSERAMALRLRWYGTKPNFIFFERKTHHEDWTGEKSVKERFGVKEKYVNRFLAGEWKLDEHVEKMKARGKSQKEIDYQINLAKEIQEAVLARKLQPCVRTFYNRTAFQHPTSQEVRISLDTELTNIREMDRTNGNWYRPEVGVEFPFSQVPEPEITRFPYAILEVKLQTPAGGKPPAWITDLTSSHLVEEVPKFSKFIHGCASLLEERVRLLPFWLPQMEKDIRKPAEAQQPELAKELTGYNPYQGMPVGTASPRAPRKGYGAIAAGQDVEEQYDEAAPASNELATSATALLAKPAADDGARRRYGGGGAAAGAGAAPQGAKKAITVPVRVEPKVLFANERTFLNWMHTSTIIATIGMALLNLSPNSGAKASKIAGLTLVPVAIMFLVYALYLYFWRDQQIKSRAVGPYNSMFGPIAMTSVFILALLMNYIFWFMENGVDIRSWHNGKD